MFSVKGHSFRLNICLRMHSPLKLSDNDLCLTRSHAGLKRYWLQKRRGYNTICMNMTESLHGRLQGCGNIQLPKPSRISLTVSASHKGSVPRLTYPQSHPHTPHGRRRPPTLSWALACSAP